MVTNRVMERIHPLRAWREQQVPALTLKEAAEKFSRTPATLSRWENWKRIPAPNDLLRINRETGIPIREIICGEAG